MKLNSIIKVFIILFIALFFIGFPNTIYAEESTTDVDQVINGGKSFISAADKDELDTKDMRGVSDIIYNVLLTVAIGIAVIYGAVLGIKFMVGAAEDKAELKESLIPYVIGCGVIFSAFAIWKLIVTVLRTV